jgi:hypothetical protein
MVFVPSPRNLAEFLITGNGWFAMVRVRLSRKLYAGISEIEAEFRDTIAGLRLVFRSAQVSCELWLYSRYGTLRHFRVEDTGIVEIDWCGTLPVPGKPAGAGNLSGADNATAPGVAAVAGPAVPGTADPRGPVLRWLAKWNAARKTGDGVNATGSSELKKILDSGVPASNVKPAAGKKLANTNRSATGPDDSGKIPGPEEPVAGTMPDAGEKLSDRETGAMVPEEKPGPGTNATQEIPVQPEGITSGTGGQSPGNIPHLEEVKK